MRKLVLICLLVLLRTAGSQADTEPLRVGKGCNKSHRKFRDKRGPVYVKAGRRCRPAAMGIRS